MGALDPGFERLRHDLVEEIRASEARTVQRFEALDTRVGAVEMGLAGLRQHIDRVEDGLHQRIGAVEANLRQHVDATAAETRRHFDVVAESLRPDVILVAEGLAGLDEKTGRFHGEVREEFTKMDRRFLHLEARVVSALDHR